MKVYKDIKKNRAKIVSSIRKFGSMSEHNYHHYSYLQTPTKKCVFFDFGKKRGVMTLFDEKNNIWEVTVEILAPDEERIGIFTKFLHYALVNKKAKKVSVEFSREFKFRSFKKLKHSKKYKLTMNCILYWPVYDLKSMDRKLSGKKWKKLRNIRNRFRNRFNVKVKHPIKIDKNILREILFSWNRKRKQKERVNNLYYLNIIENNFRGFEMARVLMINGEPCSLSAGWKIPNNSGLYCGVGIFNYRYKYLGDFANLDDMMHVKKMGYRHIDLGGSDEPLLRFKKKFNPEKIYKTYCFSIARKR